MIIEINKDDSALIELLENSFCNTFKNNELKSRFLFNIFTKAFIYCEESNIIGYVIYDDIYERYEIINIEVLNKHRNKKIGSLLLEKVIEKAKANVIKSITLEVRITNKIAIHLYEKYGFVKIKTIEKYYDGEDGILMEMK